MLGALVLKSQVPRSVAALQARDPKAACRGIADDCVLEFPGHSPLSGTHTGRPAIESFFTALFKRYRTFGITIKRVGLARPYAVGFTNTVLVEWIENIVTDDDGHYRAEGVTVMDFRRGKAVHIRDYFYDPGVLDTLWDREGAPSSHVSA